MAVDIDELQVRITASANQAQQALTGLADALKKVRSALTGVKGGATVADHLSQSLNSVNDAIHGISNNSIKKLNRITDALQRYADTARMLKGVGKVSIGSSVKEAEKALAAPLKDETATSTGGSGTIEQTTEQVEKLGKEVEKTGNKAKKATGFFGKFIKSISRIMLYRAIRSALKAIGEAFDTGLKNAYAFSQQHESFKRLADTMDRIKSVTSQMVNQLGAFWGEVKQFVLPVIEWIVEKLRYGFERATEFMAALNGEHQYLYARYVEEKWDDATESVKKYKHQLLGLDELNNLSKDPTGKLEGSKDPANNYYLKAVNDKVFDFANKLKDFTFNISDILFNWDDLDGQDIAKKIITGIGGVLGAVTGFTFGGVPGAIIGGIAGVTIAATIADMLFDSDKGKTYSKPGLRRILYPALGALAGGLIGFTAFKGKGALIGMTAGAVLGLMLSELLVKDDSKENAYSVGAKIQTVLAGITGALIGWTLGSKTGIGGGVKGALLGATLGITLAMVLHDVAPILNESGETGESIMKLIEGVLQGITVGVISWKAGAMFSKSVGSLYGTGIGASLALALFLLLGEIDYANKTGMSSDDLLGRLLEHGLVGLVGAAIGATITGSGAGAMIGFNIAVSLSMIVKRIDWNFVEDALGMDINNDGSFGTRGGTKIDMGILGEMSVKPGGFIDQIADKFTGGTGSHGYSSKKFASGGIVPPGTGSLFLAGEAGAEFVGNIGSTSAVANTGQMTEAIYKAAYMGMSKALKENGGGGMSGFEPATTDDLFIAMRKKASNYNKMTGNPAFA